MPLRSVPLLALLVSIAALPSVAAAQAAAPSAPAPQRVLLRWKVPQEAPLGYEYVTQEVGPGAGKMRLDLSTLKASRVTVQQRKSVFEIQVPTESAMVSVLSAKPSGDLAAKVVVTRVALPKKKKKLSKQEQQLAQAMKKMEGTVQLRGSMTDRGFVTSDLKREHRNLLALMFELPSQPVAVGDSWTHSADLVAMGANWQGESESINRVELVSLEKEAEGRTVAVIDFTLAERQDGKFSHYRMKKDVPAGMEISYLARGEFLVEEGRWRRLAGRTSLQSTGVLEANSEQHSVLTLLDSIPPKVLTAE